MSALVSRMEHSTIVEGQRLNSQSWKVHVPDFVLEKYEHRHVHIHIHIHNHVHIHLQKYMCQNMCVYAVGGWWCGVVWCCVVCCCRGVLVFGFLKLEIGKIQGFLTVNL